METVNNPGLRRRFLEAQKIMEHFSTCKPDFLLMHYAPGELLTNPFFPSQYLQFIVQGDLLLYNMPDEDSTIMLQTAYNELAFLGDMEFLDAQFTPFFVEARTDVYTLALHLDRYREILQKDPAFLLFLSRTLANKLNGATISSSRDLPLRKRVLLSLQHAREGQILQNIGHLAKTLNVSNRQLLRVLKDLCREGFLAHREKGVYEVLRVPDPDLPTKSSVTPENQASSPSSQTEGQP